MRPTRRPFKAVWSWVRRQPPKVKAFLAVISGMVALVLLRAIVHDHDNLFVAAEAVHSIGILVLIYKLMKEKTCAGFGQSWSPACGIGYGLWPSMVLISEIVQTFILADFCYYYVKSALGGQLLMHLPSGVV
ncbi:uncharacterized protein LOC142544870 [Primulina tabacum]|uniref:uncharacterized protein LOC142544870 n=1 Tax=Primulina tabacum TaxID=48773 RepID=UPI003F596383